MTPSRAPDSSAALPRALYDGSDEPRPGPIDLFGEGVTAPAQRPLRQQTDLVGEFSACLCLAELGFRAIHQPSTGFDLLVPVGRRVMRVQVKARSRPDQWGGYYFHTQITGRTDRGRRETRPMSLEDSDIYAFVAIDIRRVMFLHHGGMGGKSSLSLSRADFETRDGEWLSWKNSVIASVSET